MNAKTRFVLTWVAYLVPTFILGVVWHLVLFDDVYRSLEAFTLLDNPIIPLGLLSMVIQGGLLAYLVPQFVGSEKSVIRIFIFSAVMALFAISFAVFAFAAKNYVSSLSGWFLIEIPFYILQYTLYGILLTFIYKRSSHGI